MPDKSCLKIIGYRLVEIHPLTSTPAFKQTHSVEFRLAIKNNCDEIFEFLKNDISSNEDRVFSPNYSNSLLELAMENKCFDYAQELNQRGLNFDTVQGHSRKAGIGEAQLCEVSI